MTDQSVLFAPGSVPSDAALRASQARLLRDRSLQFSFDPPTPPKPPHVPEWLRALARFLGGFSHVMGYIFWGAVAIALALLVFFIVREVLRTRWPDRFKRKRRPARPAPVDWRPEPARAHALLEEADRLAAAGAYGDAVHILLHRSIEDIEGRRPRLVRPAFTARDIAALDGIPAAAGQAFSVICEVVERSFFGGRAVDAAGFALCRSAYESFAFAEAWT